MKLFARFKVGSLQDRLIGMALAMVSVTLIVAASAGNKAPGVVPVVLEGFTLLMLAAMLAAARWDFRRDAVKSMMGSGTSIAAIALFAFAAISCLFSGNRAVSIQGAAQIGVGVLLYFVVSLNVQHTRQLSRISTVLMITALIGALIGCAEYGVDPVVQATGVFGDHQLYGSFLMILLPFAVVSALAEKSLNKQLAAQTATVATIIALLLAHSHSAWLGAGIALISVGLLVITTPTKNWREQPGNRKYVAPGLLISMGILFLVLASPISESLINSPYSFASSARQDAGMDRQQVWHGAMRMIAEHPVTGLGASMYAYSHRPYTGTGEPEGASGRPTLFDQTHNLYLQTAAEIGIPGALALIALVLTFWITAIRRLKSVERTERRYMCWAALGASAAFAVDAFSSPSWQFGQIMILFWMAIGVGVACLRQTATNDFRRTANVISVPAWFRPPAEAFGLLGLAALLPVSVIASTRLNSFYPSTIYGAVSRTVDHIAIGVLPGKGPHYRLQLELFLRDNTGVHDGGPITLDPNTQWSARESTGAVAGTFKPMPYHLPLAEGSDAWNRGSYTDCTAYISARADLGHRVVITATYAGLRASATLDFSTAARLLPLPDSRAVSGASR